MMMMMLTDAARQLRVRSLHEWYYVSASQLSACNINLLRLPRTSSSATLKLATALKRVYPHHPWQLSRFVSSAVATSRHRNLVRQLAALFPSSQVVSFYRPPPLLDGLELDAFVVDRQLVVAYDHDAALPSPSPSPSPCPFRDAARSICAHYGYGLALIPWTWDGTSASLESLLRAAAIQLRSPT
jgi:hypothetical protein